MRSAHAGTIYDELRISAGHDGAIKSPSPQSEVPIIASAWFAAMDSSGIGEASTTGYANATYGGGAVTPQTYIKGQPMNVDDQLADAGKVMNARAANPSRGLTPNPRSPLARRA